MREIIGGTAVVGGGLAGLSLAAALRGFGQPVEVVEARPGGPAGTDSGVCLWTGALAALSRVGLGARVAEQGIPIARVMVWSGSGRLLLDLPARGSPVAAMAIRHGALVEILNRAAREVPVHQAEVEAGIEDDRGVLLTCRGGWSLRAPLAIAADGAGSLVRERCLDDPPAGHSGDSSWEGLSRAGAHVDEGTLHLYWGEDALRAGAMVVDRAGRWAWWVDQDTGAGERAPMGPVKSNLLAALVDNDMKGPIRELIEDTPEESIRGKDVLARRHPGEGGRGRVVLIGDAWHPLPVPMRLASTLAIEDGIDLAETLASGVNPVEAAGTFRRQRQAHVAWVSATAWRLRAVEARFSEPGVWARDLAVRALPRSWIGRLTGRLAD